MSTLLPLISVNGILNAAISPLDRGFTYGDGLFETCRVQHGTLPLWQFHCERLAESADRLKIPVDMQLLLQYRDKLMHQVDADQLESCVLKITITRGVGGRGYRQPDVISPTYCLGLFPGDELRTNHYRRGVNIRVCQQRLAHNKSLAGIKHLNRLEQILARAEWKNEYAEGLLLDENNNVIEATASNVFVVKNNQLFTPDLCGAGVAGIMRRVVMEKLAPALSIDVNIMAMGLTLFSSADEIFLCNSVYGIWPVISLTDESFTMQHFTLHTSTQQFQRSLEEYFAVQY